MGNGQKRTAYEYDALGRTIRTVHNFDGQSQPFTTAYGYPQSQVSATGLGMVPSSQTFPDNERVDYTYDSGGAQQSIKTTPSNGPQQTIISSILRNSRGQTIAATYGNGAISVYKYNETTNLRLNQIQTAVGGTLTIVGGVPQISGGTTLQNYGYSFDNNGNVIGVTDAVTPTLNASYGYDSLDQLISMTPTGQAALPYIYDRIGNLTGKEGTTQTYYTGGLGHGPHALATAGSLSYNYDNNGNLLSTSNGINTLTNITWNPEDMPTKLVQSGVTINQKSFLGETLWKKVEAGLTSYYLPSLLIEIDSSGIRRYRKYFDDFAERSPDGTLKFYHNDHLGSAALVTNLAGAMIARQAYMPYGSDRFTDPNGTFTPKYQFNFQEKESSGFYDYGARLYSPATGRWLSADWIATDGLNRYAYVANNPLLYTDPTGHQIATPRCPDGGKPPCRNILGPETMNVSASQQDRRARKQERQRIREIEETNGVAATRRRLAQLNNADVVGNALQQATGFSAGRQPTRFAATAGASWGFFSTSLGAGYDEDYGPYVNVDWDFAYKLGTSIPYGDGRVGRVAKKLSRFSFSLPENEPTWGPQLKSPSLSTSIGKMTPEGVKRPSFGIPSSLLKISNGGFRMTFPVQLNIPGHRPLWPGQSTWNSNPPPQ